MGPPQRCAQRCTFTDRVEQKNNTVEAPGFEAPPKGLSRKDASAVDAPLRATPLQPPRLARNRAPGLRRVRLGAGGAQLSPKPRPASPVAMGG